MSELEGLGLSLDRPHRKARIAVLGAGGVGGYYGGLLARAGHEVAFIARGAHLDGLRQHGLWVESVHGDFRVFPAEATDDPAQVGAVDLLLVTVKTYDLEQAAELARPLVVPGTAVLPLLNGLDAAERLAAVFGEESVLAGLTHISATITAPGRIRQTSAVRQITFGERKGTITARALQLRDLLATSGADVVLTSDVEAALWSKFLFIASISGVCCLAHKPMGTILNTPETRQFYLNLMKEVDVLGRAWGVVLPPDIVEQTLRITASFAPESRPSLLVALEAGRPLELEAMSGTVVRLGAETGVPTPLHGAVYAALLPSAAGS